MPSKRNSDSPFELRSSRTVWSSPWFSIRQDEVVLPNGMPNAFNIVNHPGAVWVIPVTDAGEIVLIHQYRQTVNDWCWELPAGGLKFGMSLEGTARQELKEEVGGTAEALEKIGQFYTSNGISNEVAHLYLATGVTLGESDAEPAEALVVHTLPIAEVLRMARANEISDGPSTLALLLCEEELMALQNRHESTGGIKVP
jgi:ADP-ribose pyrophosphatase